MQTLTTTDWETMVADGLDDSILAYADWLEEQGEVDADTLEAIRLLPKMAATLRGICPDGAEYVQFLRFGGIEFLTDDAPVQPNGLGRILFAAGAFKEAVALLHLTVSTGYDHRPLVNWFEAATGTKFADCHWALIDGRLPYRMKFKVVR